MTAVGGRGGRSTNKYTNKIRLNAGDVCGQLGVRLLIKNL